MGHRTPAPLDERPRPDIGRSRGRRFEETEGADDGGPRKPQKGELLKLIDGAELWHTPDQTAYVTLQIGKHRENWPVRSRTFRMWLAHRFFAETGAAPGAQATEDSLRVIEGRALFDGPEHKTWLRVGEHDGDIYLDLCDDEWRAVRVTPEGCRVIADPPIKFVRSRSMLPLPEPDPNGKIELLYDLIHVRAVGDERMIVACLSGWLRPRGPYPVLALSGEQGATKTTTGRAVRYMIDPHELKDRGPPRDEQTLIVSARNSWICAFDNLSRMPEWLADAICRLSTGGGFASRELYTGFDEVAIHVTRPVILTGIEDIATRGDLADRTIHVKLPPIDDSERITEDEFWAKAEKYRPAILGALLNGLASALKHADERPEVLTRMADFCAFVHRAEPGLGWCRGDFLAAYLANRGEGVNKVLDDSPIARAIRLVINKNWCGRATAACRARNVACAAFA